MKILFIYPEIRTDIPGFTGYYAEGPAILSAVLKARGHQTSLLHLTRSVSRKRFQSELRRRDYDLIGFSSLSPVFAEVRRLAPVAKEVRDVPVVYGGVHPTLNPEECLSVPGIDAVCVGEGEQALVELVERLEQGGSPEGIQNLWVQKDGKAVKTPTRGLIEDLDSLPLPDFPLFQIPRLFSAREGVATLTASRGCPFHCSYCSNHRVRDLYPNRQKYVRFKSVRRTIEEAGAQLSLAPRLRYLDFSDDIFILKLAWLEEFAHLFPREVGRPFICNAMVRLIDEKRVSLLRQAGCTMVTVGLESGSERLRHEIMNRPRMTNEMILEAGRLLRRHGIKIATYNMIGLPTETVEEAFETISLNARLKPAKINEFIFQPYPQTAIFDKCVELNIYNGKTTLPYNWRKGSVLVQDSFPPDQVVFLHRYFRVLVLLLARAARRSPASEDRLVLVIRRNILPRKTLTKALCLLHTVLFNCLKIVYVKVLSGSFNRRAKEFTRLRDPGPAQDKP